MIRPKLFLLSVVLVLSMALLIGCGDEEKVLVTPAPVIKVSVLVSPDSVETGGRVSVEAVVQSEASGPFTYAWTTSGGSFSNAKADSTGWTAPDTPELYTVSVVVSNGSDVGIGVATINCEAYLPTEDPYYMGVAYCATCHGPEGQAPRVYEAWSQSVHAGAIEALQAIGQGENAYCLPCHTVGSKGLNADPALDNGGYDETAVARLADVQCENCHGPASDHSAVSVGSVEVTIDADVCGQCHTDTHHPTYDEWQDSGHSNNSNSAALRSSCAKCHNGLFADEYLNDPEGFTSPTANPTVRAPITCAVCHDPHGNENPGSLRDAAVTDRSLPNSQIVEAAGAGRLCMSCHNGRRSTNDVNTQISSGSGHLGPHHSCQGDMLAGVNAYQNVNGSFPWSTSRHILVEDACVTCHTHPNEGDPENGIANFTGHTFEPTVAACAPCHGEITSFEDVRAKQDYDGNGAIEGVQVEVLGLLELLEETIIEASLTSEDSLALVADFEVSVGDTLITTADQRKAAYNWAFVSFDGSKGVHNATYSVQLLQQSILFLDPGALPKRAHVLRRED